MAVVDAGEQRPGVVAAVGKPGVEGDDRVGRAAVAVGDADGLATVLLVGLGSADRDQKARGAGLEVGAVESGEVGAAQGAGVAE